MPVVNPSSGKPGGPTTNVVPNVKPDAAGILLEVDHTAAGGPKTHLGTTVEGFRIDTFRRKDGRIVLRVKHPQGGKRFFWLYGISGCDDLTGGI